jgi:hypothetical protein
MRPRCPPRVRFSGARNRWGSPAVRPRFACRTRWCSAERPGPRNALSPARGIGTDSPDGEAPGLHAASSPFASVPSSFEIRAGSLPRPSRLRAHDEPRRGAHASCPGQGFRCPLWSYHSAPRTGPSFPRRCTRPQGHERVGGPICASEGETHWWNRKHAQRKLFSVEWWQTFTPAPRDRFPRLPLVPPVRGRTVAAAASRRAPGVHHRPRISCSPQSTQ